MDDNYIRISLGDALERLKNHQTVYYKSANYDEDILKFDTDMIPSSWARIAYILLEIEFYKKGDDLDYE